MKKNVREATFQVLRELGVTKVFGNPGSTEETFLENFPEDFTYIETLQEASAVAAADGYSQGTGNVSIVNVHTAAGLSNAMSNMLTASMNKTPLIITAGNQTREMLLYEPWLSNIEPEVLPKPFVKWSYQPVRPEDVPGAFVRAYAMATQEPAGPVFLSIPLDDWDKSIQKVPEIRTIETKVAPDPKRIKDFSDKLNQAKNPVLILGSDVARSNGWEQAIQLAETLNIPVWSAPGSERTPFPENHPLYVGGLPFAIKPLSDKLKGHDLALVIGAPVFRYYPYVAGDYIPKDLTLLHITDSAHEASSAPVGNSLVSNALLAIKALIPLVTTHKEPVNIEKQIHRSAPYKPSEPIASDTKITALELFSKLNSIMPNDTILVEESPSNLGDLHKAWSIDKPDSFYTFASGSLGWGLPASIGLALAERSKGSQRKILTVIGDGSFQYAVQGLWSAVQHKLPILFVVPKNSEYGILKSFAIEQKTENVPGLDIPGIDFVSLAKAYGCEGRKAETSQEVEIAVRKFLENSVPTIIEVPIASTIPPLL